MYRFWDLGLHDALRAIGARRLLEIGVFTGEGTRRLLGYCEAVGGHLDCVDPEPSLDVAALVGCYGPALTFHSLPSLEALPAIQDLDAALIDGDHNWYTVFHELALLERGARARGRELPLVFLHDVGWPYGRRDMYYAPERIPESFRQPYARKGILRGESPLSDESSFNAQLCNALEEGGPRNGVLTAVEDFIREGPAGITLHLVPAFFGLGVLVPPGLRDHAALRGVLDAWESPLGLRRLLLAVEEERVAQCGTIGAMTTELEQVRARAAELARPVGFLRHAAARARGRLRRAIR